MSSKRRIRRKMERTGCGDKHGHETEENAMVAVRKTLIRNRKKGYVDHGFLKPYKCRFCGKWHIGHTRDDAEIERFKARLCKLKLGERR